MKDKLVEFRKRNYLIKDKYIWLYIDRWIKGVIDEQINREKARNYLMIDRYTDRWIN